MQGTLVGVGGAYTFVNSEAATYVAAMTTQPDTARKLLLDTLIGGLKTDGIWTKFDAFYILAAHDSAAALINAKNPGTYNLTAVNSLTFTTDRGYLPTTGWFTTGYTPSTAGGNLTQNSAHIGCWSRTNSSTANYDIGAQASGVTLSLACKSTNANLIRGGVQTATISNYGSTVAGDGHFVLNRSASNANQAYRNGTANGTSNVTSAALIAQQIIVCGRNVDGTVTAGQKELAAAHWGSSLSGTDVTNLYNRLNTYMTAVGA